MTMNVERLAVRAVINMLMDIGTVDFRVSWDGGTGGYLVQINDEDAIEDTEARVKALFRENVRIY